MSRETPFIISVPQESLSLLGQKLRLTTFPDELDHSGWDYGAPLADIRRLVARWSNGYDCTRDIDVDGHGVLNDHYVHICDTSALRPRIFFEARKFVPLLTRGSPDHPSFHVVAISLPGFGFSEAPKKKGFALDQYAEVCNKLMLSLGYNEYVTQGGDWGFIITRRMAHLYGPKHVKAWHTNFAGGNPPSILTQPLSFLTLLFHLAFPSLNPKLQAGFDKTQAFINLGSGYNAMQSTKPQTLGYSMADSPVGLLAWIYEKLVGWTDGYAWDDDEVLTWVSIYWFSRAGPTAAACIYYEVGGGDSKRLMEIAGNAEYTASVPHGISRFPGEVIILPKSWAKTNRKIVFDREHERGGHFAAYERPGEVCGDLREMFGKGGPAFGVVKGRNGYE